ncbi:MAG: FkbM family methyltransferase [Parachlamydiales bacterium]|nr:FkbM family methyltransferase [Parachlamydiales bacterium]
MQDRTQSQGIDVEEIMSIIGDVGQKTVIELGAGDGQDSVRFLRKMRNDDRFFAVEADPRTIGNFCIKNDKRVTLIHAAISNEDKESGIFNIETGIIPQLGRPHYDGSSARLPTKETYDECPWLSYEKIQVPYITLDTIINRYGINKIDCIWCDVEGNTRETIQGGVGAFKITKYFYTEVKHKKAYSYEGEAMYDEIVSMMESIGFELVFKFEYNAFFRNLNLKVR